MIDGIQTARHGYHPMVSVVYRYGLAGACMAERLTPDETRQVMKILDPQMPEWDIGDIQIQIEAAIKQVREFS